MKFDLNCDLGEGEPLARTRALMRAITSANIACGGHAGDIASMTSCIRLAKQFGVRVGAHPGAWSRADMGRSPVNVSADELELLLLQQVSALGAIVKAQRVRLHHIKLHGALYHAVEADEQLARAYVRLVRRSWPGVKLYARAGGLVAKLAGRERVEVWEEAFADRAYRDDVTLVPRNETGALVNDPVVVKRRIERLLSAGEIESISGKRLRIDARTICIHSDTPNAPRLARVVRSALA